MNAEELAYREGWDACIESHVDVMLDWLYEQMMKYTKEELQKDAYALGRYNSLKAIYLQFQNITQQTHQPKNPKHAAPF